MKATERLQRIQDAQGFVVVWSDAKYKIGDVIRQMDAYPDDGLMATNVAVIGFATYAEHVKQVRRFLPEVKQIDKAPYYYKVIAE